MVHILKRPGQAADQHGEAHPTRLKNVIRVGRHLRCLKCGREMEIKQSEERSKGTLPVVVVCPVHGTASFAETLEG